MNQQQYKVLDRQWKSKYHAKKKNGYRIRANWL